MHVPTGVALLAEVQVENTIAAALHARDACFVAVRVGATVAAARRAGAIWFHDEAIHALAARVARVRAFARTGGSTVRDFADTTLIAGRGIGSCARRDARTIFKDEVRLAFITRLARKSVAAHARRVATDDLARAVITARERLAQVIRRIRIHGGVFTGRLRRGVAPHRLFAGVGDLGVAPEGCRIIDTHAAIHRFAGPATRWSRLTAVPHRNGPLRARLFAACRNPARKHKSGCTHETSAQRNRSFHESPLFPRPSGTRVASCVMVVQMPDPRSAGSR